MALLQVGHPASLPNRKWLDDHCEEFQYEYGKIPKQIFKSISRYWAKRHLLFSRFDEGIYMNEELWYSVTPEAMAIFTAKFIKACDPSIRSVLDVFCGGGGNLIQFARFFDRAFGVEYNEINLYCAEHNCQVYGVEEKTNLKLGSWTDLVGSRYYHSLKEEIDFIFSSPPWGGPSYKKHPVYDLETELQPMGLRELLESFFAITTNVGLFLPKNSSWDQLSEVTRDLLGDEAKCRVMFVYDQDRCKGIMAFWGEAYQVQDYDFDQELEKMPYYYMSEKMRSEIDDPVQSRYQNEPKSMTGRYPERSDDDKYNQRYTAGDYSENFYDDQSDQIEAPGGEAPRAWFDPTAQLWYSIDPLTRETVYVSETAYPPQGYFLEMSLWQGTEDDLRTDYLKGQDAVKKVDATTGAATDSNTSSGSDQTFTDAYDDTHDMVDQLDLSPRGENTKHNFLHLSDEDSTDTPGSDDDGPPEESSSKLRKY
ncbi:CYFA0S04e06590g1_1 [Cyberlindnera fabianii]|uniref:Trimethylguanosine synthase n=1 Tax=Cyberlindnera fabianii TaxID=36022 RepID=A0A061ASU1_CYBFA|nr:CYFA0S04e06590g1_1 [Cyberlindnera fabianii]